MQVTTPATTERLVAAFRATLNTPDNHWAELRSLLLTDFRTERDGVFVLGRLATGQMIRSIDSITTAGPGLDLLRTAPVPSIDPIEVTKLSTFVRRMTVTSMPEVLHAAEKSTRALATELLVSGTAQENYDIGLESARILAASWRTLLAADTGCRNFYTSLEAIPPIDMAYFGNKLADWALDASWQNDPNKRREMIDAVLASLVYVRLRQRSIVPPLELPNTLGTPQGVCVPATRLGRYSGPYRVSQACRKITYQTETLSGAAQRDAMPGLVVDFAPAYSDGYYYFYGLAPGKYLVGLATNVMPGVAVDVTLIHSFAGSRIRAVDLRDAINAASPPNCVASVELAPTQLTFVRLTCSYPVEGPSGWLRFHSYSDDGLKQCFPQDVYVSTNYRSAADLAADLNPVAPGARFVGTEDVIASGKYAYAGVPTLSCVAFAKTFGLCTLSGTEVIPDNGELSTVSVGDECIIAPSTVTTVVEVRSDRLVVDQDVGTGPGSFSVSPPLVCKVDHVGWALHLGNRWYRFESTDWRISGGLRYVDLGATHGHYEGGSALDFTIIQQSETLESLNKTTASYLKISSGNDALMAEIGFSGSADHAQAFEWTCNSTEKDGFRSRLRPGDFIVDQTGITRYVSEVHDGYLRLAGAVNVNKPVLGPRFFNAVRAAWETMLQSFALPTFDVDAYERAIEQANRTRDGSAINLLIARGQALASSLAKLRGFIDTFNNHPFQSPATVTVLRAVRRLGLGAFYKQLQVADLGGLSQDTRRTTDTGITAEEATTLAQDFVLRLNAIERIVMGMQD